MNRRKTGMLQLAAVVAALAVPVAGGDGPPVRDATPEKARAARPGATGTALFQKLLGMAEADSPSAATTQPSVGGERRITLQIAGTDIGTALRLVAEQGGLNLVIGPGVEGQVSAYLEDVPVQTALWALAVKNGFEYTVEDGVITVSRPVEKAGEQKEQIPPIATKIFTLQWQDAQKVKDALEFALTQYGKIKVLNENSDGGYQRTNLSDLSGDLNGSSSGTTSSAYRTASSNQSVGPSGTGTSPTGQETARNARKLLVTDTVENLQFVADLIADLDQVPPQVLIEVRIVEMSTDLQRQLGIDWDVNVLANGPVLNHTLPLEWRAGFAPGDQIRYNADGRAMTANPLALGTIDFSRFQALFRVHQTDNAIRLLANPRLLVFNNHSASILVGERYPILQANITDQGTLTEAFDTYIPVGIQLEVTPSIMSDGRITMLVHPATSSLGDEVIGTTGLRVRRILTREIDTRIIMQDGQTVVLGGLISDRKIRNISKIPGLGDLPVLDALFRQESPASQRVDLLVFVTAHLDKATEISERDQRILDMYQPHFKHIDRLQDVPVHFEVPTEYETPKPMFGDARYGDANRSGDGSPEEAVGDQPAPAASKERNQTKVKEGRTGDRQEEAPPKPPSGQRAARRSSVPVGGSSLAGVPKPSPRFKPAAPEAADPYHGKPAAARKTPLAGRPEENP